MRKLPVVGQPAEVIELGARTAAVIVAVDGPSLTVETAGDQIVFDLHANTGHWVRRGDPYWGVRLRLL